MKKAIVLMLLAGLAACGSKAKKTSTTPDTKTEMKSDANGGTTYGGAKAPAGSAAPMTGADPCAGK